MSENGGMSCKELVELVTDYLDGAMPDDDRARFEAHLALCPPCVEYLAQIESTIRAVGASWHDVQDTPQVAELLELFRDYKHGPLAHLT
jgi:anti-sigma factor (TIGR02949 family)